MQNYTDNANGDVPLIVEIYDVFNFLWDKGAHLLFSKEKENWWIPFFTNIYFYWGFYLNQLTLSLPEKLKNLIFEMPIIPQTLNIKNYIPLESLLNIL